MTTNKHKDIGIDIPDTPQPIPYIDPDPLVQATKLEYAETMQNKYSNNLVGIDFKKGKKRELSDYLEVDVENLTITFDKSVVKGVNPNDTVVYDMVMENYRRLNSKDKNPFIEISIEDYMAERGIDEVRTARNHLEHFYNVYYNSSVELKGKEAGVSGSFRVIGLRLKDKGRGVYRFKLDETYAKLMKTAGSLLYPTDLRKIDNVVHPQAFLIARKIYLNKRTNKTSPQADRLSVKSLLHVTTLPDYEHEKNSTRHQTDRIMRPFLSELLYLVERGYFKVDVLSSGDTYDLAEFANMRELGWGEFYNSMLIFRDWKNYPNEELTKLERQKANHVKKAIRAKEKQNRQKAKQFNKK